MRRRDHLCWAAQDLLELREQKRNCIIAEEPGGHQALVPPQESRVTRILKAEQAQEGDRQGKLSEKEITEFPGNAPS